MLKVLISGVLVGLVVALLFWTRQRELDAYGNLCLRYLVPRYVVPLVGIVFLIIGLRNLSDPFHQKHPENSFVEFGFAAFALLASLYFVPYRVSLTHESIERHWWPLRPRMYPLSKVESVGQNEFRFSGGGRFKISPLLSGQKAFMDRVRALTIVGGDRERLVVA